MAASIRSGISASAMRWCPIAPIGSGTVSAPTIFVQQYRAKLPRLTIHLPQLRSVDKDTAISLPRAGRSSD